MSLDSLRWFTKLAEFGSFTKAADNLELSQQTLSARLASLEKDLDAKLVVRGNPLSLTPAGQAFLAYAKEQQQAQQEMLRQIGEVTGGGAGLLKIGISHMRGRYLMPGVVKAIHSQLPDVTVHLIEGTNRELTRKVERGEIDAAVARFPKAQPGVKLTPLYQEEVVLTITSHLLEEVTGLPSEEAQEIIKSEGLGILKDCPFILCSVDDISGRIGISELRLAGIRKPKTVAISESLSTIMLMCAQGLGAGFIPMNILDVSLSRMVSEDLIRIPISSQGKYAISLGTPMNAEPWRAMDIFTEALVESCNGQRLSSLHFALC